MNNRELIDQLTRDLDNRYLRTEVRDMIVALSNIIANTLSKGETINITGIGKFGTKTTRPRRYYNIHSKQMESSQPREEIIFTPSNRLSSYPK